MSGNGKPRIRPLGFTVLAEGTDPIADIIFVHGLRGGPKKTWAFQKQEPRQEEHLNSFANRLRRGFAPYKTVEAGPSNASPETSGVTFWPAEFLPQDCSNARIITYGYDSSVTNFFRGAANQNTIYQHAKDMLYKLERVRAGCETRPIIFIAHSLGGIVVKDILRRSKHAEYNETSHWVFKATHAIIFLGTPHRGSAHAAWGEIARNIANAALFDTNSSLLDGLKVDSSELDNLREEFAKMLKGSTFKVHSFQEGKGLVGLNGFNGKVVEDASSALDDAAEVKVTINANHMDMCRFESRDDDGYKSVEWAVRTHVMNIRSEMEARKLERSRILNSEQQECLRTLAFDGWRDRRETIENSHKSTYQWIDDNSILRDWIGNKSKVIWISGKPGSGKSTFSKHLVHKIEDHEYQTPQGATIASFFFNDRGSELGKSEEGLLRALMHQILRQNPSLFDYILPEYLTRRAESVKPVEWKKPFLREILLSMVCGSKVSVRLVIDAFDECEPSSKLSLLELLDDLSKLPSAQILITSRPDPHLEFLMKGHPTIRLEDMTLEDMETYIKSEFEKLIDPGEQNSKAIKGLLANVRRQSQGVFLWVKLVIQELKERVHGGTVQDLRDVVGSIPGGLQELYGRIFEKVDKERNRDEAQRMLEWVIFAERPLTVSEFRYAIAIGSRGLDDDFDSFDSVENSPAVVQHSQMENRIRKVCGGLLEVKEGAKGARVPGIAENQIVQLIHQSVKDFLLNKRASGSTTIPRIIPPKAHTHLARVCIAYLSFSDFDTTGQRLEDLRSTPFFDYAARYWITHAPLADISETATQMEKFGRSKTQNVRTWSKYIKSHHLSYELEHKDIPLIIASWIGLLNDVKFFLEQKVDGMTIDLLMESALQAAAYGGHEKVAQLLIDNGADVNLQSGAYGCALQAAACGGHEKVAQLLIDNGADVNLQSGAYGCALQAAACGGHEKVAQLLIDNGADVNLQGGFYGCALQAAAYDNHEKVVQLLIDNGADVDLQGGDYRCALQAAAYSGHEKVAQLLIDNGADVNLQGGRYGCALQAAACGGHEKVAQLLIDNGADVNLQGGFYGCALQAAAYSGHEKVAQLLIDNGADVNLQGGFYGCALQAAAYSGHEKVAQLLINNGANVNLQGGFYGCALQAAAYSGHEKVAQLLIDNGADVNLRGGEYGCALQAAKRGWYSGTIRLLIKNGASMDSESEDSDLSDDPKDSELSDD